METQERTYIYDLKELDIPSEQYLQNVVRYKYACNLSDGKKVLDIACGTGYGSHMLSTQGNAFNVTGVDISQEAINIANSSFKAQSVHFLTASAYKIPLDDESKDFLVSFETLEHLEKPLAFLEELRRISTSNSLLLISTPKNETSSRHQPANPYHICEYNYVEFYDMLKSVFPNRNIKFLSQITEFHDDSRLEMIDKNSFGKRLRRLTRSLLPNTLKSYIKKKLGIQPFSAGKSYIVDGVCDSAHVQIALIK